MRDIIAIRGGVFLVLDQMGSNTLGVKDLGLTKVVAHPLGTYVPPKFFIDVQAMPTWCARFILTVFSFIHAVIPVIISYPVSLVIWRENGTML